MRSPLVFLGLVAFATSLVLFLAPYGFMWGVALLVLGAILSFYGLTTTRLPPGALGLEGGHGEKGGSYPVPPQGMQVIFRQPMKVPCPRCGAFLEPTATRCTSCHFQLH